MAISYFFLSVLSPTELLKVTELFGERSSLYINEHTFRCARISCGGVIELCDAVCSGRIRNGMAIVRPPGHHAEPDRSMGFCLFNNVAVATRWIQQKYGGEDVPSDQRIRKILILDWDVHHGNGTQRAFEEDDDVLYVSLHRYDNATFYPCSTYGASISLGTGKGRGFSINIPWPGGGMGDGDYIYAFHQVVMPIAAEFGPDLVIISAGFDAAMGDPLGGCNVTPIGYAQMTWMLMGLAQGRVIVALEGGYDPAALAMSALAVTHTLLGDPVPSHPSLPPASSQAVDVVSLVKRDASPYWACIEANPLNPYPDIEAGLPRYSLPELLRAHRQQNIAKTFGLSELPVLEHMEGQWQSHALCSDDLMDRSAAKDTVVVFAHDMGSLKAGNERPNLALVPDTEAAYLIDSSTMVLQWAQERGHAIVDVNLFPSGGNPPSQFGSSSTDKTAQFLEFLWDTYLDLCPCRHIVFLAHSGASKAALALLSSRRLDQDRRVVAVGITMGHEAVPMVPRDDIGLRKWYLKNGRVFLPETHPWWAQGEDVRKKAKRAGRVVMVAEKRPIQVLRSAMPELTAFVESRLELALFAAAAVEEDAKREEGRVPEVAPQVENAQIQVQPQSLSQLQKDASPQASTGLPPTKQEEGGAVLPLADAVMMNGDAGGIATDTSDAGP